jgi:hypothetical protein
MSGSDANVVPIGHEVYDLAKRQYAAARANADSARANATQAIQIRDALIEQAMEGAPIQDSEIAEASKAAQRALTEARVAEELAETLRRALPDPEPVSEQPRPKVRVVSAISALAWREKVLAMPQDAVRARGLDPYKPPLISREEI